MKTNRCVIVCRYLVLAVLASSTYAQDQVDEQVVDRPAKDDDVAVSKFPPLKTMLEQAMRTHPNIQVAEAELERARAVLRQKRFEAAQRAVEAWHELKITQKSAANSRELLKENEMYYRQGRVTVGEVIFTYAKVAEQERKLARAAAKLTQTLAAVDKPGAENNHEAESSDGVKLKLPQLQQVVSQAQGASWDVKLAENLVEQVRIKLEKARFDLRLRLTTAYRKLEATNEPLERIRKLEEMEVQKFKLGRAGKVDILRARQHYDDLIAERIKLAAQLSSLTGVLPHEDDENSQPPAEEAKKP